MIDEVVTLCSKAVGVAAVSDPRLRVTEYKYIHTKGTYGYLGI